MSALDISRRRLITAGAALGGLLLSGCDRLTQAPSVLDVLDRAEGVTRRGQRLLLAGQPLAREFQVKDISPVFKANGSIYPGGEAYRAMVETGFADWRFKIYGLVQRPLALSLDQIKALPARTQITRHDCVEGWSAIGGWTGAPLGPLLHAAGLQPHARYAVFHCADELDAGRYGSGRYYESIDLFDAFHPQTLLAYALNGKPLDVAHGAPVRLRVERQLGYKQAKYVMGVELVDRLDHIEGGKGGYWEDRGYEWYAGI